MQPNVYSGAFRSWQAARKVFDTAVKDYAAACATFEAVFIENPEESRAIHPQRDQILAALELELPQIASNLEQVTNAAKMMKILRNRYTAQAPINRLSSELLVRVFESFDHSGPLGPTLEKGTWPFPESVACVNTSWRQLALNNGQLWSRINFDLPSHLGDKLYQWAETRLKNSQGHRIVLSVHEATFAKDDLQKLLDFLPRFIHRLAAIRFRSFGPYGYSTPDILSCWLKHNTDDATTELQLTGGHNYSLPPDFVSRLTQSQPIELIEHRFSHVRCLTLHHFFINWSSRLYDGLVELDILFVEDARVSVPIGQFARVLSASPMLRTLKLRGLHLQDSSPRPGPVHLGNLETLFLKDIFSGAESLLSILQPGSKPTYMRLPLSIFDPDPCLQLLMRSRVVKLVLVSDSHGGPLPALLTILPITQHLVLVNFKLSVDFFLSMNSPLALRGNSQCPTVWPHLRSLHLIRCWFPNDFAEQIIQRKAPTPYHFAMWTSHCIFEVTRSDYSLLPVRHIVQRSTREQPILQALQSYIPGAQGTSNDRSPFLHLAWKSALDFSTIENPGAAFVFVSRDSPKVAPPEF